MLTSGEIVELIESTTEDRRERVLILNELIETILHNPSQLCYDLEEEAKDIADGDFCYLCGSELIHSGNMQSSEYFGTPVSEYIPTVQCSNPSCSYTLD